MKKFIIYCEGGFGNRLNSLYSGLSLCTNCEIIIAWPLNNSCGAAFNNIFSEDKWHVVNNDLEQLLLEYPDAAIFSHRQLNTTNHNWFNVNSYFFKSSLINDMEKFDVVIFTTPLWLLFTPVNFKSKFIELLKFNNLVIQRSQQFNNFKGKIALHLRGSDYGHSDIYFLLHRKLVGFFRKLRFNLFTDDEYLINQFGLFPNVSIVTSKNFLPTKLIYNQPWAYKWDKSRLNASYNIYRDAETTIVAVSEFIFLSNHKFIIPNSRSTFLYNAILFSNSNYSIKLISYFNRLLSIFRFLRIFVKSWRPK